MASSAYRKDAPARGRRNQLGQLMGAKGIQTRRRLLDATAALLDCVPLRELTVAQIIRASGVSAATFYVYFPDVSDAVLAVIGEVTQSPPGLLALFADPWPKRVAFNRSHEFVATYVENVQRHASLFRVRNLASDEGDVRFSRLRLGAVHPLIGVIATKIEQRQASGELPRALHATHTAGALLAMIERIAVLRLPSARDSVYVRPTLMHAAAYLVEQLLGDDAREALPRAQHKGRGDPSQRPAATHGVGGIAAGRAEGQLARSGDGGKGGSDPPPAAGGDAYAAAYAAAAGALGRRYRSDDRDVHLDLLPLFPRRLGSSARRDRPRVPAAATELV